MTAAEFAAALEELLAHVNAGRQPTVQEFARTVQMRDALVSAFTSKCTEADDLC